MGPNSRNMGCMPCHMAVPLVQASNTKSEFSNFLLVVESRETAQSTEGERHRRSTTSLDNARHSRTEKRDTVAECQLSTIVLVLLDQVSCHNISSGTNPSASVRYYQHMRMKHRDQDLPPRTVLSGFAHTPLCRPRPLQLRLASNITAAIRCELTKASQGERRMLSHCNCVVLIVNALNWRSTDSPEMLGDRARAGKLIFRERDAFRKIEPRVGRLMLALLSPLQPAPNSASIYCQVRLQNMVTAAYPKTLTML